LQFSLVFAKVKNDKVSLTQVWNAGNIKFHLRRGVSSAMRLEKNQLTLLLHFINFSSISDTVYWNLDKSELYLVHSLYKFSNSKGVHISLTRSIWALKNTPQSKIIFMVGIA
jgi:hypothetical protein